MNKMIFFTISTSLLLAFSSNVPAGNTCVQEADLFTQKASKVKLLYQNCEEAKLNSKACKQYKKESDKAALMMKLVLDCIKLSGDAGSSIPRSFWDSGTVFGDDLKAYIKRSNLDIMEKM